MTNFHLGVWSSDAAISDDEAAGLYAMLSEGKWTPAGFNAQVYAFYSRLIGYYPEIDLVPEYELEGCPWACALDVSGGHVLMAIQPDRTAKVVPLVLALAEQHGLVCFDPQAGKVHLPPRLQARRAGGADM